MKDKNVEVLLHTPLLVIATRDEIKTKPVLENVLRLTGKILNEESAGILLAVKTIGSDKTIEKNPPFAEIFIPFHKIDHIIVL